MPDGHNSLDAPLRASVLDWAYEVQDRRSRTRKRTLIVAILALSVVGVFVDLMHRPAPQISAPGASGYTVHYPKHMPRQ